MIENDEETLENSLTHFSRNMPVLIKVCRISNFATRISSRNISVLIYFPYLSNIYIFTIYNESLSLLVLGSNTETFSIFPLARNSLCSTFLTRYNKIFVE